MRLLLAIALVSLVSISACYHTRPIRSFENEGSTESALLFDRYELEEIAGYAEHTISDGHFVLLFHDKDTTDQWSRPLLMIDTACMSGDCYERDLCYVPGGSNLTFYISTQPLLPIDCQDERIWLTFYARLVDRDSDSTVAADSQTVPVFVKSASRQLIY